MFAVFAELPRLLAAAVRLSWRADRLRTTLVAVATIGGGVLAAFAVIVIHPLLLIALLWRPSRTRGRRCTPGTSGTSGTRHSSPGRYAAADCGCCTS
jgi:ATP-binding cassette, subfamily B, bacterial